MLALNIIITLVTISWFTTGIMSTLILLVLDVFTTEASILDHFTKRNRNIMFRLAIGGIFSFIYVKYCIDNNEELDNLKSVQLGGYIEVLA